MSDIMFPLKEGDVFFHSRLDTYKSSVLMVLIERIKSDEWKALILAHDGSWRCKRLRETGKALSCGSWVRMEE